MSAPLFDASIEARANSFTGTMDALQADGCFGTYTQMTRVQFNAN
jgi:hypothetical protein